MENESQDAVPHRPTADDARRALDGLSADGAKLAHRVETPWWYHAALAIIVFVVVGAQALPGALPLIVSAVAVIALVALTVGYANAAGISSTRASGRRSRRILAVAIAALVVGMVAALAVKFTEISMWWAIVPAALAAAATVVLGERYDAAVRAELAETEPTP